MSEHQEKCPCESCQKKLKLTAESWRLKNRIDHYETIGDQTKINEHKNRLKEIESTLSGLGAGKG